MSFCRTTRVHGELHREGKHYSQRHEKLSNEYIARTALYDRQRGGAVKVVKRGWVRLAWGLGISGVENRTHSGPGPGPTQGGEGMGGNGLGKTWSIQIVSVS